MLGRHVPESLDSIDDAKPVANADNAHLFESIVVEL